MGALLEELQELAARAGRWRVGVSQRIIDLPGAGIIVPDLELTDAAGVTVAIEVLGFWSREAVWRRVELAEQGLPVPIVFVVGKQLRVSEQALPEHLAGCALRLQPPDRRARRCSNGLKPLPGDSPVDSSVDDREILTTARSAPRNYQCRLIRHPQQRSTCDLETRHRVANQGGRSKMPSFFRFYVAPAGLLGVLTLGIACTGKIGEGSGNGSGVGSGPGGNRPPPTLGQPPAPPPGAPADEPGEAVFRRLTRVEYNNTIRDLLGDTSAPADAVPR